MTHPLPGIWGALERKFTIIGIAQILGTTTDEVRALAENPAGVRQLSEREGELLADACLLHGVRPVLYRYTWVQHRGIFIASTAQGWRVWSVKHSFTAKSAWLGSMDEIKLCDPAEIEMARLSGFPG